MPEETYLGDGLFASCEGAMIKLRAPREDGSHSVYGDHVVFLEPEVYAALKEFARKIGWEPEAK
jgi:hypothetical protein